MNQAALTDIAVRKAKPRDKRYTLNDGQGLELEVMTSGPKFWRLIYRAGAGGYSPPQGTTDAQ